MTLVVPPTVVFELWTANEVDAYGKDTRQLRDRVRNARNASQRSSPALDALVDGLDSAFGSYQERLVSVKVQALEIDNLLSGPDVDFAAPHSGMLSEARGLENEVQQLLPGSRVGSRDCLILATILNSIRDSDVFLTFDEELREFARAKGVSVADPNKFAKDS